MDEADDAQKAEALFLREALGNFGPIENQGCVSLTHCLDCGEEIPAKRRLAVPGCLRCHECQVDFYKDGCR